MFYKISESLNCNQWYHVVSTTSEDVKKLYINGQHIPSQNYGKIIISFQLLTITILIFELGL